MNTQNIAEHCTDLDVHCLWSIPFIKRVVTFICVCGGILHCVKRSCISSVKLKEYHRCTLQQNKYI